MIDMHCHVLYGVDDGSESAEMTREMLARAKDAGITALISTPHVYAPKQLLQSRRVSPRMRALAHEARLAYGRGCEFSYRALLGKGGQGSTLYEQLSTDASALDAFTLAGTRCILLELPVDHLFPDWEIVLTQLAECGYHVIIAHPERYAYIQRDIRLAEEMISYGCEMQLDAGGLMAGLFSAERRAARRLLDMGFVSYIASDAHRPQDYAAFAKAARAFSDEWPRQNRLFDQLRHRKNK